MQTISSGGFQVPFICKILNHFEKLTICSGGSRIFPRGVRQLPKVLLFFNFVPENCMKMKEFGSPGGRASLAPPLDPPMIWVEITFHVDNLLLSHLSVLATKHTKMYHIASRQLIVFDKGLPTIGTMCHLSEDWSQKLSKSTHIV